MNEALLNIRWTIGDVSPAGFEALRLSLHGAYRLFGPGAAYHVCVNTIALDEARRQTGAVPDGIRWHAVAPEVPLVLRPFLDSAMSEGTAWKFLPLQIDPGVRELALDNDVILWAIPDALARWLADESGAATLIAADVLMGHGQFAHMAGPEPRNSGIRGTPAGFDLESAIAAVLRAHPAKLESELDEQGLQIAAMSQGADPLVVGTGDVSICSPFPPHQPGLGRCGAHFVGLNARSFSWDYYGRPAHEVRLDHWRRYRMELYRRVGLTPPAETKQPSMEAAAC
ncbi:hypothetical protein CLG96_03610 [Sphingomonas oleivorans]|uniref:Uncharacterized protein n=1 Tax=Sphingomonas oleivorans TaxID=1735121 RepID=A0A2T5G267_9SPHN|nr:hypothetical protein [Sphingomonas oleivorans]PTQ13220.1 hypothetical protein CLG96_03610 [Sphingomonas oleivorans]